MTFTQLTARLNNFLRGWLLVLGLKEGLVECATVCVKSEVILTVNDVPGKDPLERPKIFFGHYSVIQINLQRYDFLQTSALLFERYLLT